MNGRRIRHPQGRLLGGSSGINNQAFITPSAAGIDAWEELGNDGWGWATMEPYYRSFYTINIPDQATKEHLGLNYITNTDTEAHGPVQVSYTGVVQDPLAKAWIDTFKALKHGMDGNPFSGRSIGGYANAATVDPSSKTRSYSATAYYAPAASRVNLSILTGAQAEKLDFVDSDNDKVAVAVHFTYEGKSFVVGVHKEIVVAAGTFQSPKLLELSGVGNAQILKAFDIPVAIDNAGVGENLQDHLMTGVSFEVNDGVVTGDSLMRQEPEAVANATQLYQNFKAGPMTVGGIASHAFMPLPGSTTASDTGAELRDVLKQFPINPENNFQHDALHKILETPGQGIGALLMFLAQSNLHNDESAKDYLQNLQPGSFISLGACQSHVFSRGSSHIASRNASDPPKIDPQYLSDPLDLELFAMLVRFLEQLAQSPPLSHYLKRDGRRNHPSAYVDNLDAAKDYIRATALSGYHPAGTCAMLPRKNGGVVSNQLIVYGTRNVRVVDASVMPLIPRGNLQSTVYAVAERAADLIKASR